MPRPANGSYRLFLPPIPWPALVVVTDAGARLPAITGPTVYPYSEEADAFSIAPDSSLTCDDASHWTISKGGVTLTGSCETV